MPETIIKSTENDPAKSSDSDSFINMLDAILIESGDPGNEPADDLEIKSENYSELSLNEQYILHKRE